MVQKIYSKMHLVSCTNTHHDVTDLVNHGMAKNTKTWISSERNITFLRNKTILNLCIRWHNLGSYRFVAEVIFNNNNNNSNGKKTIEDNSTSLTVRVIVVTINDKVIIIITIIEIEIIIV